VSQMKGTGRGKWERVKDSRLGRKTPDRRIERVWGKKGKVSATRSGKRNPGQQCRDEESSQERGDWGGGHAPRIRGSASLWVFNKVLNARKGGGVVRRCGTGKKNPGESLKAGRWRGKGGLTSAVGLSGITNTNGGKGESTVNTERREALSKSSPATTPPEKNSGLGNRKIANHRPAICKDTGNFNPEGGPATERARSGKKKKRILACRDRKREVDNR